ncbi:D-2-hydroxyacid dehydrogenase [Bosea sp. TAF32]|uniref:D-2-hydroxyacid dehydrogenase n=1 Tax=Bosea sp. TAF32 TaxID=3237482 RepID=UPI003F8DB0B7
MKVIVWTSQAASDLARGLQALGAEVARVDDQAGFAAALPGARALVTMSQLRDAQTARALHDLGADIRWVQLLLSGYDAARVHGIPAAARLTTVGDAYASAVAEHAMALMLGLARRLDLSFARQAACAWAPDYADRMQALDGAVLTVVGLGAIGREIARRARAFGMRIIGVKRQAMPDPLADEVYGTNELDGALARADIIVLAAPLTSETRHMIGARQLAICKPTALLVNVGRGALVDSAALRYALHNNELGGAGLDVTHPEPPAEDDPLWDCPNLILTPHMGGRGHAPSLARAVELVIENAGRFIAARPLLNEIDDPAIYGP